MLNYVIVVLFSPSRLLKKNRIPTPQSGKSLARFYYVTDKRRPVSPVLVRAGARRWRRRCARLLRSGGAAAMKVAVAGCCHGALDKMYETLELLQRRHNVRPDLLLCCGDFQAVRNEADLRCMAVPAKYRHMQTFYRWAPPGPARPGLGPPGPAPPRPGPLRYSCSPVPAGTTPARRRPRSSRCSLGGTTRRPTTCRSCPTAGGWRPTSTTSVGSPAGVFPSSPSPCPGPAVTSRFPVSTRLRGRGAVPRCEDWRHLGHLQISWLPERYGGTEWAWLGGRQGGERWARAGTGGPGCASSSLNQLLCRKPLLAQHTGFSGGGGWVGSSLATTAGSKAPFECCCWNSLDFFKAVSF